MGTVSVKMPDEDIKKLEEVAENEGKTKSSLMREMAERELGSRSPEILRNIVGLWSEDKAKSIEDEIKEKRTEISKGTKESIKEKWN